jgi:zinc/manganese transport system substrate-binding protein
LRPHLPPTLAKSLIGGLVVTAALLGTSCSAAPENGGGGKIVAIGAENEYANVLQQVGGKFVSVTAILSNPNTDPHTFEASPDVAQLVSEASLVIQNGIGYDTFMNKIEDASPNSHRRVIDVQTLLHLPNDTRNPHLWYKPDTMPAVARAIATDLSDLAPSHQSYFRSRAVTFISSLSGWYTAIKNLKAEFPGAPVATTEPVGDYMLRALGLKNLTPWALQADIMNGVDPSPQAVTFQLDLFSQHKVKAFVYNQQVVGSLTESFLTAAKAHGIPVVGVYETMPTPGYDYQSWMRAEVNALRKALADHISTQRL